MRDTVAIMAKHPSPGAVKTRLARAIGESAACDLYRAFLCDLQASLGAGPWRLLWAVHPPGADLAGVLGGQVECVAQRGADLAERMHACVADLCAAGAPRVLLVGADAPQTSAATVAAAFAALDRSDVVLQPTRDGGYCLVGLRAPHDLFRRVPMSVPETCARTLERAGALGLTHALLPPTFDVDEVGDLEALRAAIEAGAALPATARALLNL